MIGLRADTVVLSDHVAVAVAVKVHVNDHDHVKVNVNVDDAIIQHHPGDW
jgi:hypothetical protein